MIEETRILKIIPKQTSEKFFIYETLTAVSELIIFPISVFLKLDAAKSFVSLSRFCNNIKTMS